MMICLYHLYTKFKKKLLILLINVVVVDFTNPKKKRKLIKSRYHIPLKTPDSIEQMTTIPDVLSNPDESSIPDTPDINNLDGSPVKAVTILDSPALCLYARDMLICHGRRLLTLQHNLV